MTEFDGRCPFCRSENTEVKDSTSPAWGNNDEGDMIETWTCLDCHRGWNTEARVNVVRRKLELIIVCPYCATSGNLDPVETSIENMSAYRCHRCHRFFWIRPEDFYTGGSE